MNEIIRYEEVENKVITIRDQQVIIDRDVAALYGVETREINQAIKNNPDKFPDGYILRLDKTEVSEVIKIFDNLESLKFNPVSPSAFTEKGLYMLATILKSPIATQTTIAIVEAFAKLRELSKVLNKLPDAESEIEQKSLMQIAGSTIMDIFDNNLLETTENETALELNLAFMKFKRSVKREKVKNK
jgi:hypothetical protein